ncbi:VOC family protein [Shewanella glacialipiscicola]|uniref:VOC domain-containing protein n=1 Tax=Shewanella glacialipiscicola TaxID=614069 RepID=A0ABQ6J1Z9_9GAMM|nr:VOC family protein [Shewanella glacialipiscicola]MCL1087972.1 VOC family protein [Shewanella glacialipiscicola]GIU18007.1 hypothetical protein TUM4636_31970 [Shewanella glacialipiscicola]GMA82140.1 hypothetical protein GCM10025855_16730 [Shewanella glacialipiscicola]
MSFSVSPFSEALCSVVDFEPFRLLFCDIAGWKLIHQGLVDASVVKAYQLGPETSVEEMLLANPKTDAGFLRLYKYNNVPQQVMRSNDQSWDTGGIFDYNVRIKSMAELFPQLQRLGWRGATPPVSFKLGESDVIEWIAMNHHVRIAFIERVAPKLVGWEQINPVSQMFNSSQIVTNIDESLAFYCDFLGFKLAIKAGNLNKEAGANPLGIPLNRAHIEDYELAIVQPGDAMIGSVELVKFNSLQGHDFSANNQPPNLGMQGLRFKVSDAQALSDKALQQQVTILSPLQDVYIAGLGNYSEYGLANVKLLTLQSPDGAWLEFYQPLDAAI